MADTKKTAKKPADAPKAAAPEPKSAPESAVAPKARAVAAEPEKAALTAALAKVEAAPVAPTPTAYEVIAPCIYAGKHGLVRFHKGHVLVQAEYRPHTWEQIVLALGASIKPVG